MISRITLLKNKLEELQKLHRDLWSTYGSELCTGDMVSKEKEIEIQIKELENGRQSKSRRTRT